MVCLLVAMRTLAHFDAPEDAYLFRAFLESRGIGSSVLDEHVAQLFWHYRRATGGVRVVIGDEVDPVEAEAAREEYFSALAAREPVAGEVRWWPVVLLLSWFVGGPLLLFGRKGRGRTAE
jgi:hypothetical protein